mgnify:CR=1 FL=1
MISAFVSLSVMINRDLFKDRQNIDAKIAFLLIWTKKCDNIIYEQMFI